MRCWASSAYSSSERVRCSVKAGQLRQRVTIQQKPTVTRDGFGAEAPGWSTLVTLWAKVETLTGREFVEQARAGAELTHKVTVRYYAMIAPTMRVAWGSRILEIAGVLHDDHQREMTLLCNEAV